MCPRKTRLNPDEDIRRQIRDVSSMSQFQRLLPQLERLRLFAEAAELIDSFFIEQILLPEANKKCDKINIPLRFTRKHIRSILAKQYVAQPSPSKENTILEIWLNPEGYTEASLFSVMDYVNTTLTFGINNVNDNSSFEDSVKNGLAITIDILTVVALVLKLSEAKYRKPEILAAGDMKKRTNNLATRKPVMRDSINENTLEIEYSVHWVNQDNPTGYYRGDYTSDWNVAFNQYSYRCRTGYTL